MGVLHLMAKRRGFTLIEMLVVITIIGILITLIVGVIGPIQRKSRDTKRKSEIALFLGGLNEFKADFKIYPNFTMYLGSYGTSGNGGENSNFALSSTIPQCNGLPANAGQTASFADLSSVFPPTTTPTAAQIDANPVILKEGSVLPAGSSFSSVNHFLVCLRYLDRVVADVSKTGALGYQVRFSYDFSDVLVSAEMENASDPDAKTLYNAAAPKRYYQGSGLNIRQLDEDSNISSFYSGLSGTISDGMYLYQCLKKALPAGEAIITDDRSGSTYDPIIYSGSAWAKNTACQDASGGLNVVRAY
ncbi:hypothetical protein A3A71_00835 [Candidatus Berkelbacteria bacterium RIFCSPLOWO2_01_FULL_50_28]|uniref:Type II secretion system protein GspG C-terminal domain-containing protein n=1 Tax=Candidatus Berkelbacteria bacterium RIFCSPLOWO2_01_FULL_50_28 TaxID=1797471 RepID=A0A1F5EAZ5_9BACT|nr:MAG: hypothetical protein A2807_01405 [Candidatus Berkelbacteria bacterium RIFCSPHIGHO2_01_FULL_50_36]OGD64587.1 MAG: hypothetical protein A3A71_00835 [Candidatus Berkelbacteria bacterium RIFCSPLOWO2_01_FULL_50_28]